MPKRKKMIMNCGARKERRLNHATPVIKKTGKLKFIEVFETLPVHVAKSSVPHENSQSRSKNRPKLLRKPGELQEIPGTEIHGSLAG